MILLAAGSVPCTPPVCVETPFGPFNVISDGPVTFVSQLYGYGLSLIGGVALIVIMYGGYIILTSQGNPTRVNKGKQYITYAIIGLLLAIFGFIFMQLIGSDLLHIPGFG